MSVLIQLENVSKTWMGEKVLENVDVEIVMGEMVAIQGASGSGKSILLDIIGTLIGCDSGKVSVCGYHNIKPNSKESQCLLKSQIAFLFQSYAQVEYETLIQSLELLCNHDVTIAKVLLELELSGYERRRIATLTPQEQQRVALAQVSLKPCKLILADDPTGNLDATNSHKVMKFLTQLREQGKTVVVVTHDRALNIYFDRIITLQKKT